MPAARNANQKRLLDFLVDMGEYELDSALRSVGSRSTPAGWRDYKLATKRLSLNELLGKLSDERLSQLAEAYAADLGEPTAPGGDDLSVPSVFEAREVRRRGMPSVGDLISSGAAGSTDGFPGLSAHAEEAPAPSDGEGQDAGSIFVVHGRDHDAMNRAARVLERTTRRDVTVLHEQANGGRTLLEKFEGHASTAAYAVVLLTGDDIGGAREQAGAGAEGLQRRARQNVIFELGFFCAALGRGRVAVLLEEGVEKPSDLDGLVLHRPGRCWGVESGAVPGGAGRRHRRRLRSHPLTPRPTGVTERVALWSKLPRHLGEGGLASMHAGCALSLHASRYRLQGRGGHHRCSGGQGSAASVLPVLRVVARGGYQLHHRTPLPSPPTEAGAASKLEPAVLTGTRSATSRLCASARLDTIRGILVSMAEALWSR